MDLINCVHHKLILCVWFTTMLLMYTCAQKGNAGVEGINGVKITESEKNPYSSEETVGFFMVDIFEAYRGCYIIEDCFEKESFFYYDIFSPYQDEGYHMEWKAELVKMTGNTVLAKAVNHFHEILFENSVKEMKQLAQDGSGLFYMGVYGKHIEFDIYEYQYILFDATSQKELQLNDILIMDDGFLQWLKSSGKVNGNLTKSAYSIEEAAGGQKRC